MLFDRCVLFIIVVLWLNFTFIQYNFVSKMAEKEDEKFTFTWMIENYSMHHHSKREYLSSPCFVLNSLPAIRWCIQLYPEGYESESHISVCVSRVDNISESFEMKYSIEGLNSNEKLIFSSGEGSVDEFEAKNPIGCYKAFSKNDLFRWLKNDILIIKCTLEPAFETTEQDSLPQISYENFYGPWADLHLHAGYSVFRVHKAMLSARWPKMLEKLDTEETSEKRLDIHSNVLEAILQYVYTGKLECSEPKFLLELNAAASKYQLPNLQFMSNVAQKARTCINVRKISFQWPIHNFSSLPINTVLNSHVFSVDTIKSCRWNLLFRLREEVVQGKRFDISVCKINESEPEPTFVRSKISFDETGCCENKHLFRLDKKWKCAELLRSVSEDPRDVLRLQCELKFSDCSSYSQIVESSCAPASCVNCHYFNDDLRELYRGGKFSDIDIVVGSKTFRAHKFILCGRSSVFSRMFQTEMTESKMNKIEVTDVDADIMDELLAYIYTGYLEKPLEVTTQRLYVAADKYDIPSLKKKCSSFLVLNLAFDSVCKILQLAHLHSDDDLYDSVVGYVCENDTEIFATKEWKEFVKDNYTAKFLQNVIEYREE